MRGVSDYWTQKAKKEGYPARSVYKLREINEKFSVLPRKGTVLDLGASPGSWTRFILRGGHCAVVAADLEPLAIEPHENLSFYKGDFTHEETLALIRAKGPYNALVSDAAPATTGNRTVDSSRSEALARHVLEISRRMLIADGACVIKIFQGDEQRRIMEEMKGIFALVKAFKPRATRSESFETYLVGLHKKHI